MTNESGFWNRSKTIASSGSFLVGSLLGLATAHSSVSQFAFITLATGLGTYAGRRAMDNTVMEQWLHAIDSFNNGKQLRQDRLAKSLYLTMGAVNIVAAPVTAVFGASCGALLANSISQSIVDGSPLISISGTIGDTNKPFDLKL